MKREFYEVHMTVVDANGNVTIDPGNDYPKKVDSMSYDNDVEKTLKRAMGLLGAAESAMSTQDTRQIQYGYPRRNPADPPAVGHGSLHAPYHYGRKGPV